MFTTALPNYCWPTTKAMPTKRDIERVVLVQTYVLVGIIDRPRLKYITYYIIQNQYI